MKLRKSSLIFLTGNSILFIVVAILLIAPSWNRHGSRNVGRLANLLPVTARAAEINPWTLAVEKVKEDRGEPMGKQAKVETPAELRHYSDTRRFLATQVAEVKQHQVETPQDLVDLAAMIGRGKLVQLKPVNEHYILFGVGGNADDKPFTRFQNGKSISLYNEASLRQEYRRLAESQEKFANDIARLKKELGGLKRRERAQRAKLQTELSTAQTSMKHNREDKALLDHSYGDAQTRQQLFADYELLEQSGQNLSGSGFDMADGNARRKLKVRLLSSLRPEAAKVLEEIAASYHEKFNRPLPMTSLVRPDEYQLQLSKTNPNATRIEIPPHSTGLAFDILYRYMTAAEQAHVMAHLAQLKDAGRIEVLRENRDHYHVFAFVDGVRPREEYISASLGEARPAKVEKDRSANIRESHHRVKNSVAAKRDVHSARRQREPRQEKRNERQSRRSAARSKSKSRR